MREFDRRGFIAAAGSAAITTATFPKPAIAQAAFPSRALQLIVPAPAGSRHGVSARLFAEAFAKELGKPVEVVNPENTPALSYSLMAGSKPDGYTMGYATVELSILHWRELADLRHTDFTPLALLCEDPAGIHVKSESPWQTAKDLTEHIKANPGKLKASSTAAGGIWHLSTVGWLGAAGMPPSVLPWIPAAGPAAAVEEMMLGAYDIIVCSTPEVRAIPQAKQLRTLAVMARQRIPRFADVPTLQEAIGTAHTAGAWRGLVAPKNLDPAIAAVLTAAAKRAWDNMEFQLVMQRRGYVQAWLAGQDFALYMADADARMGATLKAAGVVKV